MTKEEILQEAYEIAKEEYAYSDAAILILALVDKAILSGYKPDSIADDEPKDIKPIGWEIGDLFKIKNITRPNTIFVIEEGEPVNNRLRVKVTSNPEDSTDYQMYYYTDVNRFVEEGTWIIEKATKPLSIKEMFQAQSTEYFTFCQS